MIDGLVHALSMAFAMGWEILWPLVLGFTLSAIVQAVVSRRLANALAAASKTGLHLVGAQQRWRHVEAERLGVSDVGSTVHIPQARRDYCDGDSTVLIRGVLGTQHMRKIAAMGEHSNRGAACSQWGYCS
jgi:hypothetical protein